MRVSSSFAKDLALHRSTHMPAAQITGRRVAATSEGFVYIRLLVISVSLRTRLRSRDDMSQLQQRHILLGRFRQDKLVPRREAC